MSVGTGTLALSLGLCLCAGQLVATPAVAATTTPVTDGAAQTVVTPRLTERVNKRTIKWGQAVSVTARVLDPRTGKAVTTGSVRLQAKRNGKWKTLAIHRLNSQGSATFRTTPSTTSWFRSQFTGAGSYRSTTTRAVRITVKASGSKILAEAKRHRGALYKFGASGPKRFDCSGYTQYVYRKAAGKKLPHRANDQQRYGKKINKSNKQIGDLIVFRSGSHGYHAGIYAGGGYIWDSPRSGKRVGKHKIWSKNYVVRRIAV
ncbi:cell wall-associated NlpC family hydrolase [Krasilnikovia cinnamomea]|uniref:Cell wall-associated NlpC family hydrolase n=1 Tax=Krasilnikovia cinnamomea TaxID=349313 RepID=A0A4Q7ZPE6_9ACTN|nr:C40 family peptidase [Krasilnikovia cinnamomea]RZU52947.1 cell wall-associated NlpC family hydrolase [Krasilnikovia cinnamomea]